MNAGIDIPVQWKQAAFSELFLDPTSDVVDGPFGSNLKASEYQDHGVPVLRIQNIDRNRFVDKNINFVTGEKAEFLKRHSFRSGDIIITKLGMPVGKACFVPKKYDNGIIVADLIRARITHELIDPRFLVYQINSNLLVKQFEKFTKGTTRPRVNLGIVRQLIFNIPPLNEQHRIVSKIEELLSELDNGVTNLKLAQNQLKIYRQALLKHAFEGKFTEQWRKENNPEPADKLLERIKEERQKRYEQEFKDWKAAVKAWEKDGKKGKRPSKPKLPSNLDKKFKVNTSQIKYVGQIPNEWTITNIAQITGNEPDSIVDGPFGSSVNVQHDYIDHGVPVIRINNILPLKFSSENLKFIRPEKFEQLKRHNIVCGDVLLGKVGTIGNSCIYPNGQPEGMLSTTGSTRIRVDKAIIIPDFLSILLNANKRALNEIASAAVQAFLNMTTIKNFPIPLMTLHEQELIVNEIQSQFSIIDNLEQTIESGLQKSEALRQSILKKAFEGKLVPQDPNDEPASELLKRIQAEKKKYLEEQKQQKKQKPKNTKKMSKELTIEEVLKTSNKPMLAKDVWQKSKHKENIEDFYKELKDIKSKIKEVKKGTESLLSLAK